MKKTLFISLALFFLLGLAGSASAQTYAVPCYEWNCSASDGNCDFDAGSCTSGGGVWYWHWNFGDGNSDWWNTSSTISHFYSGGHTADVTLTLSFFGQADDDTTCSVHYRNVIGPPQDLIGDCDASPADGCNC